MKAFWYNKLYIEKESENTIKKLGGGLFIEAPMMRSLTQSI